MKSLEQKIKELLEGKDSSLISEDEILDESETIKTKGGATITDDDDDQDDDHQEPDGDEDGEDTDEDGDGEDQTEFAKDKKDNVKVNEDIDPASAKLTKSGEEKSGEDDNSKIKAGLSKTDGDKGKLSVKEGTDPFGKLTDTDGTEDGSQKTSKTKAGLSKKDGSTYKLSGPSSGGAKNDSNDKNFVDVNPVSEHIDALMNGEDLSEEFRQKATTIFEAAVTHAVEAHVEALQEEFEARVAQIEEENQKLVSEAVQEVTEDLTNQIDAFLNYVVEQWVTDNKVAIESGIKVDLTNSFIDGLKTLFKEHYVSVPDESIDVVEEQAEVIDSLTNQISDLEVQNEKLQERFIEVASNKIFAEVCEGLTVLQIEKFKDLAETVEFTTEEDFSAKLETIKENYFSKKTVKKSEELSESVSTDNSMSAYVEAISKNIKFTV